MSRKIAILVLGPESSGNKLLGRCMIACGCEGDGGYTQRWEETPPVDQTPIVWTRSQPLGGLWPDAGEWIRGLRDRGYYAHVLVPVRNREACVGSQVERNHAGCAEQASANINRAWREIVWALPVADGYEFVSYEGLIQHPQETVAGIAKRLGLKQPEGLEAMRDANAAHF